MGTVIKWVFRVQVGFFPASPLFPITSQRSLTRLESLGASLLEFGPKCDLTCPSSGCFLQHAAVPDCQCRLTSRRCNRILELNVLNAHETYTDWPVCILISGINRTNLRCTYCLSKHSVYASMSTHITRSVQFVEQISILYIVLTW
jgi:hypothetical protein